MLNTKQQEVVEYKKSLVNIAGPGSGKTHTLISKIASIVLSDKKNLNNILVLTFTNTAAKEIRNRSLSNIDIGGNKYNQLTTLYFGTYHSIFKRLLKEENVFKRMDLGDNPTITMPKEISRYFTNLIKNDFLDNFKSFADIASHGYYEHRKVPKPAKLSFNKTILKNELIDGVAIIRIVDDVINYFTVNDINKCKTLKEAYDLINDKTVSKLKDELKKTLKSALKTIESNSHCNLESEKKEEKFSSKSFGFTIYSLLLSGDLNIDSLVIQLKGYLNDFFENKFVQRIISFGDIMLLTLYSLTHFEDFRENMQIKFKNIFVDEFQDTNVIQGEILYLLHRDDNICVIGDPYQSIYAFLGAKIMNILNASKNFNAKTIQLVENYRSNHNIVALTNELGVNMIEKIDNWKPCVSSNKSVKNNPIRLLNNVDEDGQSKFIIEKIKEFSPNTKVGVINRSGNVYMLESALNKARLKYDKLGGEALGESTEIKFLIHLYIYLFDNNKIDSLLFILDGLSGIGTKSIEAFEKNSLKQLREEFKRERNTMKKNFDFKLKAPKKIEVAMDKLKSLTNSIDLNGNNFLDSEFEVMIDNIKKFYYESLFPNMSKAWKSDRIDEANDKINILFDEIKEKKTPSDIVSLLEDYINGSKRDTDKLEQNITVTTIHSSKGLEWDVVFLMNWDNKIFERDDKSEAQRLAYVSISRAKEELFLLSNNDSFFEISQSFIDSNPDMFEDLNDIESDDIILNFGKHKGKLLDDIPYNYLEWIYENKEDLKERNLINSTIIAKLDELFDITF